MFCYYEIKVQITELTLSNPFLACSHSPQQRSSIFSNFARVVFEGEAGIHGGLEAGAETMVLAGQWTRGGGED